jgi:hypothetical protein
MIDRKLEPLVKRLMVKYLGELEDDDLVMFVLEHLKDHKGPHKLIEGLEPVRILSLSVELDADCLSVLCRYWKRKPPNWPSACGDKLFLRAWRMAMGCTRNACSWTDFMRGLSFSSGTPRQVRCSVDGYRDC